MMLKKWLIRLSVLCNALVLVAIGIVWVKPAFLVSGFLEELRQVRTDLFSAFPINEGDVVSQDFVVTNSGKQDLVIRKFKSSCGCTASSNEKDVLKAGEKTTISVTFDSKNRKGKQYKYITMFSNAPNNPEFRISIQANVKPKPGAEN